MTPTNTEVDQTLKSIQQSSNENRRIARERIAEYRVRNSGSRKPELAISIKRESAEAVAGS